MSVHTPYRFHRHHRHRDRPVTNHKASPPPASALQIPAAHAQTGQGPYLALQAAAPDVQTPRAVDEVAVVQGRVLALARRRRVGEMEGHGEVLAGPAGAEAEAGVRAVSCRAYVESESA